MREIINVLRRVADMAHWTVWPHFDAHGEDLSCPPIVTWRYKHPSDELAKFLHRVIGSYRGTIAWDFSSIERKWVLMPARIREYTESQDLPGELLAAAELKVFHPDFGKRANSELALLAEHIRNHLDRKG